MSRLTFWLIALLLQTYCNKNTLAQNISEIQPTIEKERQIEKIRNKILKELINNGAKILRSENRVEQTNEQVTFHKEEIKNDFRNEINTGPVPPGKSKVMVTPGEPVSPHTRDKCLAFHLARYIKNVDHIIPKKINLWVHLRRRGNKKNKKKKLDKLARAGASDLQQKKDNKASKKKDRKKNRKRKQGRRIKIFISDGKKTLVKMRMRVIKTKWYKIELPISQFPDVISVNDSFKLCFKCKRCSKKIKMDLYRKGNGARQLSSPGQVSATTTDQPTIPFIHFEEPRSQTIYRYKRSTDVGKTSNTVINNKHRHGHNMRSTSSQIKNICCSEEIYKEQISKVFPSILYPESINISLCVGNTNSYLDQPLLSQKNSSHKLLSGIQCAPDKYETFNFVYVDTHFKMHHASIPDLIPVGCSCRYIT